MAIQCELDADRERGPGHGVLKISGLGPVDGPLDLSLMRNQGTAPYLGRGGHWQATESWHTVADLEPRGDALVARVGPDIVDAIVALPTTVAYRLTAADGARKQAGTLKVNRPLLGSTAAAAEERPQPPPPPPPEPEPEPEPAPPEPEPRPEPIAAAPAPPMAEALPPETQRGWLPALIGMAVLLLLVGGGAYAYFNCLISGFGPASCAAPAPVQAEGEATPAESETAKPEPAEPAAQAACADAEACMAAAAAAVQAGEAVRGRELYQKAARMGSVAANVRIAEMYDPETWSAGSSPVSEADWDTAAYWYEEAARQGDRAAQIGAGRVLCRHAPDRVQQERGLRYLQEATAGGADDAVQQLVNECKGKLG